MFWSNVTGAITVGEEHYSQDDLNSGEFPGDTDDETYADDPEFAGPDDFRLRQGSPAIDSAGDEGITSNTDLQGNPRLSGETIDRGAYEM